MSKLASNVNEGFDRLAKSAAVLVALVEIALVTSSSRFTALPITGWLALIVIPGVAYLVIKGAGWIVEGFFKN